jgi:hypothetical protein
MRHRSPEVAEISAYDRMCWPDGQLEQALRSGAHRRELAAYLGPAEYALLASLAKAAGRARPRRQLPKVYLLPGIMGSQLGCRRTHGLPPDLLWLDPTDIVRGRLSELRWGATPRLTSLGGIGYSYLPLKLRLEAAGFSVTVHDYDWRADLRVLGAALAARLRSDDSARLALIGHSMGGLLARAALAHCAADPATARRVVRVIGMGTPHGGSIAAVQALRASYPMVFRLAAVDRRHDAKQLSRHVFGTFTSLYQLLPAETGGIDLFDPGIWPQRGVQPHLGLLAATRGWRADIAPADERFASIIGTGQRTVTGLARRGGQFRYEVSTAGDGTVAATQATLPGARNFYLRCEHSELPRSAIVAAAVCDLLRAGRTRRLPQRPFASRGRHAYVTDAELRRSLSRKIDWQALTTADRRRYFARLNGPPPLYWPT